MVDYLNSSQQLSTSASSKSAMDFLINKRLMNVNTIILGEVLAVDIPNKRLTVKSLINGVDTKKNPIAPPTLYNVPYSAIRGGDAGIITEFIVGDSVVIGFCQRQIDLTKKTGVRSTPNLTRFHALNDAVVLSHWSNTLPKIFIKITDAGIEIDGFNTPISVNTTQDVTINANNININATDSVSITAENIGFTGPLSINGAPFLAHTHTGVTSGTDISGPVAPAERVE